MRLIHVKCIEAFSDDDLSGKLTRINGRIIQVEQLEKFLYRVIYEYSD